MKRPTDLAIVASALCLLAAAACGQGDDPLPRPSDTPDAPVASPTPTLVPPTPTTEMFGGPHAPPYAQVSPSLEEQVFHSDTIVRASLLSASAGTETVPSDPGVAPTYRPIHELRFTVHEYLKGSGPTEIVVVVRADHTYLSAADALEAAEWRLMQRKTTWDGRQGALFLGPAGASGDGRRSVTPGPTSPAFEFTLSNYGVQTPWDYSVDTLSRAWLPSSGDGSSYVRSSDTAGLTFITDGTLSPPPVVSLSELRSQVTELEATLASGAGVEGFRECVQRRISRERWRRAQPPWTPAQRDATLASGLAAGTEVHREDHHYSSETQYHRFWLSGPDADLFQAPLDDNDSLPANGYYYTLAIARPLPAGEYRVRYSLQDYAWIPCNFVPDDAYWVWTVTVTVPPATVHEAFFDPVAIGAAVGTDGSNGVLKPAAFTVGGASATITRLQWEAGAVTMALNPSASLAGHAIDFIALDGSVTTTPVVRRRHAGRGRRADVERGEPALERRRQADATRNSDGNPDSPNDVVFLTTLLDVIVDY